MLCWAGDAALYSDLLRKAHGNETVAKSWMKEICGHDGGSFSETLIAASAPFVLQHLCLTGRPCLPARAKTDAHPSVVFLPYLHRTASVLHLSEEQQLGLSWQWGMYASMSCLLGLCVAVYCIMMHTLVQGTTASARGTWTLQPWRPGLQKASSAQSPSSSSVTQSCSPLARRKHRAALSLTVACVLQPHSVHTLRLFAPEPA
jgi:hypothetical protein